MIYGLIGCIIPSVLRQGSQDLFKLGQSRCSDCLFWERIPPVDHSIREKIFPYIGSTVMLF